MSQIHSGKSMSITAQHWCGFQTMLFFSSVLLPVSLSGLGTRFQENLKFNSFVTDFGHALCTVVPGLQSISSNAAVHSSTETVLVAGAFMGEAVLTKRAQSVATFRSLLGGQVKFQPQLPPRLLYMVSLNTCTEEGSNVFYILYCCLRRTLVPALSKF